MDKVGIPGDSPRSSVALGVLRSGSVVLGIQGLILLLGLGLQALLARLLGVHSFGDYAYSLSWVLLLSLAGKAGAEPAAVRFVPRYTERQDWGRLRGFVRWALSRTALLSAALGAALAVIAAALPGLRSELMWVLLIASVLLPIEALSEALVAMLRALKRAASGQALAGIARRLLFVSVLALAWWGGEPIRAPQAMVLNLVTGTAILLFLALYLRRRLPSASPGVQAIHDTAHWRSTTRSLFASGLFVAAVSRVDVVLLGLLRDTAEAGVYSVVTRLAALAIFGQTAINSVLAPEIARLYSTGEFSQLERVTVICARAASALALAVALAFIAGGPSVLALFGEAFAPGYAPLVVLLAGHVGSALFGSVGYLLTMTEHQVQALRLAGLAFVLNLVLNLALIPRMGAAGAAIAAATSTLLWNLALALQVKAKLGINPTAVFRRS